MFKEATFKVEEVMPKRVIKKLNLDPYTNETVTPKWRSSPTFVRSRSSGFVKTIKASSPRSQISRSEKIYHKDYKHNKET